MAKSPDSAVRAFDFPLRFTAKGDLVKTTDEDAIKHNIVNAIMTTLKGIPIRTEFGSLISILSFDPSPVVSSQIGALAARAVALMEPRAVLDSRPLVALDEATGTVTAKFTYYIKTTARQWKTVSADLFNING